jgi:hypothetical protein
MTLSSKGLYVTLSLTDTQHNRTLHYAECHILFIVMLGVIMLNAIVPKVVAPLDGQW